MRESEIKAQARYNAKLKQVCIKLNPEKDRDLIEMLAVQANKTEFVKQVLREWHRMAH